MSTKQPPPWQNNAVAPNGQLVRDNFRAWFEDSQLLDGEGDPLVVFHGASSPDGFDAFDVERQGQTAGVAGGFFFTNTHETAMNVYGWRGNQVLQVYLRICRPLTLDAYIDLNKLDRDEEFEDGHLNPTNYFDEKSDAILAFAKQHGYDGIVFKDDSGDEYAADLYVVFDALQIKSATDNNGNFDPDSSSLTDAIARGEREQLRRVDQSPTTAG